MKVQRIETKQKESFVPFAIQINVETKEEAQALFAIFNKGKNSDLLINSHLIRDAIGEEYWVYHDQEIIANGISHESYYC